MHGVGRIASRLIYPFRVMSSPSKRASHLLDLLYADFSSASRPPISTPSPFSSWRVVSLKSECRRLGLVTSRNKQGLIALLDQYYATHPELSIPLEEPRTSSEPAVLVISDTDSTTTHSSDFEIIESKSSPRKKTDCTTSLLENQIRSIHLDSDVSEHHEDENNTSTSSVQNDSADDTDDGSFSTVEETVDLYGPQRNDMDEPLCTAIFSDTELYQRILRMEPISLDEFMSVAQRSGTLTGSMTRNRARLRTWLDTQGICFYEADL